MDVRRLGGAWQIYLETLDHIEDVLTLDAALWVASSAPISGISADPGFLAFLDADQDGRVHVQEVREAAAWTLERLGDRSGAGSDVIVLDRLDPDSPTARDLRETAEQVLANLGAPDGQVSLEQVRDRQRILAQATANGDGVIPPVDTLNDEVVALVRDTMAVAGAVPDASGVEGVGLEQLEELLRQAAARAEWEARGADPALRPFGEATQPRWEAWRALREPVARWLDACELAAWRKAGGPAEAPAEPADLSELPLAHPRPDGVLGDAAWVHPRWRTLLATALPEPLTRASWAALGRTLAPVEAWRSARPEGPIWDVPGERLARWLDAEGAQATLRQLITDDADVADELARVAQLERLILNQRWLLEFANNFVNFTHFYDPGRVSLVERGALVIDGRRHALTVRVDDVAAHKVVAQASHLFLVYARVTPREGEDPQTVAAAVTSGTRGRLRPGMRGVFELPDGAIRDALVVDVLENPISLWEAITAPFSRLKGVVDGMLTSFSASRQTQAEALVKAQATAAEEHLASLPDAAVPADEPPADVPVAAPPAEPDAPRSSLLRDSLVGGGVALAAVSSSMAYLVNTLTSIDLTQLVAVVAVLILGATLPTVLLAVLKLRRRNLAAVLEGSGWAINHPMPLPRWAGRVFSRVPRLPRDARRTRREQLVGLLRRR